MNEVGTRALGCYGESLVIVYYCFGEPLVIVYISTAELHGKEYTRCIRSLFAY